MNTFSRFSVLSCLMLSIGSLHATVWLDQFIDSSAALSAPTGTSSTSTSITIQNTDPEQIYPALREMMVYVTEDNSIFAMANGNLIVNGDRSSLTEGISALSVGYSEFDIDLADNTFFDFSVAQMVGSAIASIQVTSANSQNILMDSISLQASSSPQEYFIDLTQLQNFTPTFLSTFTGITIDIISTDNFSLDESAFSFTSVPEPSVNGLLVAAGLSFLCLRKRLKTPSMLRVLEKMGWGAQK